MNGRTAQLRWRVALVLCAAWLSVPEGLSAWQAAEPPLRFRRVYVPHDRVAEWPIGRVPHIPVEGRLFEHWIELAGGGPPGAATAATAYLRRATYRGRLDGDSLVDGRAELEVAYPARSADPPAERSLVSVRIEPCNLALRAVRWHQAGEAEDEAEPLTLGRSAQGTVVALVPQEGTIRCDWTLRGRVGASGGPSFSIQLPRCAASTLLLDIPAIWMPVTSTGVAIEDAPPPARDEPLPPGEETRRWRIELGGHTRCDLRLAPASNNVPRTRLTLVRQSSTYRFLPRGLEVDVELSLDVHHEPLERLDVLVDPPLQLAAARFGEIDLPWTTVADAADQPRRIRLRLPSPVVGTDRLLRLTAVADPLAFRRGRLPMLRPEGVFWQEGKSTLLVPAPLELRELETIRCRQSKVGPLAAPLSGESIEIQHFAADAQIELAIGPGDERPTVAMGTTVEMVGNELRGTARVQLSQRAGARFALQAAVAPGWIVDAVESTPAEAIEDWKVSVEPDGAALRVVLAEPLAVGVPLTVQVSGRRVRAPRAAWRLRDLEMLAWPTARRAQRWLCLRTSASLQLLLDDEGELARLDAATGLPPLAAALLQSPREGIVFALNPSTEPLRIRVQGRQPQYRAEIETSATLSGDRLREHYLIRVQGEQSGVDRVLVRLSEARQPPLAWSLEAAGTHQVFAQRAAPGNAGDEVWEVQIRPPCAGPFELRAGRDSPLAEARSVSLAAVPSATAQRGLLEVRLHDRPGAVVRTQRLKPIPVDAAPAADGVPIRHVYRYQPSAEVDARLPPAAMLVAVDERSPRAGFIWWCHLDSRYETTGTARHVAVFQVEPVGQTQLRLQLAADCRPVALWVNGQPQPRQQRGAALVVPLPATRRTAQVVLWFDTQQPLRGLTQRLTPPLPEADLPVLAVRWSLWTPPEWTAAESLSTAPAEPQPWRQRLLGPVARPAGSPVFDPLSWNDWRGLLADAAGAQAEAVARDAVDLLGTALHGNRRPAEDWGQLAEQFDESLRARGLRLLIDRHAMDELGITAASPLPTDRPASRRTAALSLLEASGVQLLVLDNGSVTLTTQRALARLGRSVFPLPWPGSFRAAHAAAEQLLAAQPWLEVASWRALPAWTGLNVSPPAWLELAQPGWNLYEFDWLPHDSAPRSVRLYNAAAGRGLSWGALLVTAALGWWQRRRFALWIVVAGTCAALALWLPEAAAPLASAGLLGLALVLLGRLVERRLGLRARPAAADAPTSAWARLVPVGPTATLLAAIAAWWVAQSAAQEPPANDQPPPAAPAVYHVLIPVDDKQQPTDDPYQVPRDFYRVLRQRVARLIGEPQGWMLERATYRGQLAWEGTPRGLALVALRAAYELRVYEAGTKVLLPVARDAANLAADGVVLEGRPVPFDWELDGQALALPIAEPGTYRLELTFRPANRNDAPGFDVPIPALPTAELELQVPPDAPAVEFPTALGQVVHQADRGLVRAHLGPTDRLAAQWASAAAMGNGMPPEVEKLLRLDVRPSSVVLRARLKYQPHGRALRQLRLAADPRLSLLPHQQPAVADIRVEPGNPQILVVQLAEPMIEPFTMELALLATGTSGIGNLRLPALEALDARCTQRWLGVFVDPVLQHELIGEAPAALEVAKFAEAWGAPAEVPQIACTLTEDPAPWSLSTQPREVRQQARQRVQVSVHRGRLYVRYSAEIQVQDGFVFRHRLAAPPGLQTEEVSVLDDQGDRAARWYQDADGTLTVFLTRPLSGQHRLQLAGWLDTPSKSSLPLPIVQLPPSVPGELVADVYRQPQVLVEVEPLEGFRRGEMPAEALPGTNDPHQPLGRPVARLARTADEAAARLRVSSNQPQTRALQVVSLQRQRGTWEAHLDFELHVRGGVVDRLAFDIPDGWLPLKDQPRPLDAWVVELPQRRERRLLVRPAAPVTERIHVKLVGTLALEAGEAVRVPRIQPVAVDQVEQLLLLPTQLGLEQVAWETQGTHPAELPEAFRTPALSSYQAYRVIDQRFSAQMRSADRAPGDSLVRLADVRVAQPAGGGFHGVVSFDLVPGGQTHCPLRSPPGVQILQVYVRQSPVIPVPSRDGGWSIPLASDQLPQRIDVVFASTAADGEPAIRTPTLGDLTVERTLWTVVQRGASWASDTAAANRVAPAQAEALRYRSLADLLELSPSLVSEESAEGVAAWYRTFYQRLLAQQQVFNSHLAGLPANDPWRRRYTAEVALIETQQRRVAEELNLTSLQLLDRSQGANHDRRVAEPSSESADREGQERISRQPSFAETADRWRQASPAHLRAGVWVFPGPATTLSRPTAGMTADTPARWLLGGLCLVVAAAVARGARRGWGIEWLCRWPQAALALAGIAWWLWASPGWLGLVLAGVALWTAVRGSVPRAGGFPAWSGWPGLGQR